MKITATHIAHIKSAIGAASKAPTWAQYKNAGLSPMRWRWDVAHSAGLTAFFCSEIYKYADDSHIDTVLRHVLGNAE